MINHYYFMNKMSWLQKYIDVYGDITLNELKDKIYYIDIYTDGATQYNGERKSGIGVYFGEHDVRNISKQVNTKDNNECEIIACIEALKVCQHPFVNIYTDSRLIVDKMNGICRTDKCKKYFDELLSISERFLDVQYIYVKGHANIDGNEKADALSRACL